MSDADLHPVVLVIAVAIYHAEASARDRVSASNGAFNLQQIQAQTHTKRVTVPPNRRPGSKYTSFKMLLKGRVAFQITVSHTSRQVSTPG